MIMFYNFTLKKKSTILVKRKKTHHSSGSHSWQSCEFLGSEHTGSMSGTVIQLI